MQKEEEVRSESASSIQQPETGRVCYIVHLFRRTLRKPHVHIPRALRMRAPSPQEMYSMLEALNPTDEQSSIRGCYRGKLGAVGKGGGYWFQGDIGDVAGNDRGSTASA